MEDEAFVAVEGPTLDVSLLAKVELELLLLGADTVLAIEAEEPDREVDMLAASVEVSRVTMEVSLQV